MSFQRPGMWSQQKTDKEGKSKVYTIKHLLPVPPRSTLQQLDRKKQKYFPSLARATHCDIQESWQAWSDGWSSPVINHQWFLSWPGLHQNCQEPGNSGHLGDTQELSLLTHWWDFFFPWDAQVMGFRLACFLLDSLYSVYFSFCWQQSTVPRNHFASLCSTWEHLNTFADGSEPFIFWNKPWILNHLARFLYGSIIYTRGDYSHVSQDNRAVNEPGQGSWVH